MDSKKKQGTVRDYGKPHRGVRLSNNKKDVLSYIEKTVSSRKLLMEKESIWQQTKFWGGKVLLFLGITLLFYLVFAFFVFDWEQSGVRFFPTVLSTDPESIRDAIGGYIELLAAILGIMITVVAIVLQLASQRYGTRLIDLFMTDNVNRLYFILLVCSLLYAILLVFAIKKDFYPELAIQVLLFLTLIEIALLAPYFLFVFKFITPNNLLSAIQDINKISIGKATNKKNYYNLKKYQSDVAVSLEQVTDTALNATSQMDRSLGLMAINQMREMILDYLDFKKHLPRLWFSVSQDNFIGISSEFYKELCETRVWVETKGYLDMRLIFENCINTMPDAISAIAYNTRIIGEESIKQKDISLLEITVRFFNSFLRDSINARKINAIFKILYQYRLLTESIFDYDIELGEKVLNHFLYYGEQCMGRGEGLDFALAISTFDIGSMVATAYDKKLKNVKELLKIFMAAEDRVNREKDKVVFMMIRTAQLILATYLFSRGDQELLPFIIEDLKNETFDQLIRWRDMLLAITDRKFYEITDRGYNFLYIDAKQKEYLKSFFQEYVLSHPEFFKQT